MIGHLLPDDRGNKRSATNQTNRTSPARFAFRLKRLGSSCNTTVWSLRPPFVNLSGNSVGIMAQALGWPEKGKLAQGLAGSWIVLCKWCVEMHEEQEEGMTLDRATVIFQDRGCRRSMKGCAPSAKRFWS